MSLSSAAEAEDNWSRRSLIKEPIVSFMTGMRYNGCVDYTRPVQTLIPGTQGKILGVLAETTAQLNLTTISRLAGVSLAQASRVLPELVHLGLVERVEAPPSALFRLMDDNIVGRLVRSMTDLRHLALRAIGDSAALQKSRPELVIVFGSFARGEADADSDLDLVIVRPAGIDDDDSAWADSVVTLSRDVARALGNPVNILEVRANDLERRLKSRSELWKSICTEGIVVYGDAPKGLRSIIK
jgi:predicted nucleotidyltransferase